MAKLQEMSDKQRGFKIKQIRDDQMTQKLKGLVSSYPTLHFYYTKNKFVKYNGERTVKKIINFVNRVKRRHKTKRPRKRSRRRSRKRSRKRPRKRSRKRRRS